MGNMNEKNIKKPVKKTQNLEKPVNNEQKTINMTMNLPKLKKLFPINCKEKGLTAKETRFVIAYCTNGFNTEKAIKIANIKANGKNSAINQACRYLNSEKIYEVIKEFCDLMIKPYKNKFEYLLLDVYWKRAFYDICTFIDDNGLLIPLSKIDDEWRICIDGMDVKYYGKLLKEVKRYILPDRADAMKNLYNLITNKILSDKGMDLPTDDIQNRINQILDSGEKDRILKFNPDMFSKKKETG